MRKYSSYKDSGIEWIGEIPEHWKVKKTKFIVKSRNTERIPLSAEERGKIVNKEFDYYGASGIIDKVDKYLFNGEYILIGEDGANLVTRSKRLAFIARGKFWVNNHAHILEPIYGDIRYLSELFELNDFTTSVSGSAQPKLTQEALLAIPFVEPPEQEQTTIANYLDRKTAEIDTLIEKKKQLITLYQEERTATINLAVTKGLDPNVPMKDSGIDWVGEIPEHWKVKKLKYLIVEMISGPFGSSLKKDDYSKTGYKIYGQEQVIKGDLAFGDYYISEDKFQEMIRYKIYENDILISCVGTFGKVLRVSRNFKDGIINPRLIKITPNTINIEPEYLESILRSIFISKQFESLSRGGTMGVINLETLKKLLFIIPPLEEQGTIRIYLDKKNEEFENQISKTEKEIELLQEYKTALISEVVLGKVDVREEKLSESRMTQMKGLKRLKKYDDE